MPLPNTRVIHTRFSTHHRATADSTKTALCIITREPATGATRDSGTFTTTDATPTEVAADVQCRVQVAARDPKRATPLPVVDVTSVDYLVTVPATTATVLIDDVITITSSPHPDTDGLVLRVTGIPLASEAWERALMCRVDTLDT